MMTTMIDNGTAQLLHEFHQLWRQASREAAAANDAYRRAVEDNPEETHTHLKVTRQQARARNAKAHGNLTRAMRKVFAQSTGDLIPRLAAEAVTLYCARAGIDEGDYPEGLWDNWAAEAHDRLQEALWDVCLYPEDQDLDTPMDPNDWADDQRQEAEERKAEARLEARREGL